MNLNSFTQINDTNALFLYFNLTNLQNVYIQALEIQKIDMRIKVLGRQINKTSIIH